MGTWIKEDGTETEAPVTAKSLEELQKFVGGWIEVLPLNDGCSLVVNEEGLLLGQNPNQRATDMIREHGGSRLVLARPYLVGPVVLLDKKEARSYR